MKRQISDCRFTAAWIAMGVTLAALMGAGPATPTTNQVVIAPSAVEHEAIRHAGQMSGRATTGPTTSSASVKPVNTLDLKRVGLSLSIVIALIFAARIAMKRLFPAANSVGRNSQIIRVVSRSVVGPKQQFLLVQLGKRLVLVGDSGSSMNPLTEINDPEEVAALVGQLASESNTSSVTAFTSMFRKAGSEFQRDHDAALAKPQTHSGDRGIAFPSDEEDIEESDPLAMNGQEPASDEQPPDRGLVAAAAEINGLMDRVRVLSKRIRR